MQCNWMLYSKGTGKYHSAEFVQIVQNSICDETVVQAFDSAHKQSAGLILLTVT